MTSHHARTIAQALNITQIPSDRSPLHAALRTAEIEAQAEVVAALLSALNLPEAAIAQMIVHQNRTVDA